MPTKERWARMGDEEKQYYKNATKLHQLANPEYWREANRVAYLKKHGALKRNMHHTEESRAQWARDKANNRCTRAKRARFSDELTQLVTKEAHSLRKLRNVCTDFEWHVDHILPLKGKSVSGLHIWSNLQVIPKIMNLKKGNKEMVKFPS